MVAALKHATSEHGPHRSTAPVCDPLFPCTSGCLHTAKVCDVYQCVLLTRRNPVKIHWGLSWRKLESSVRHMHHWCFSITWQSQGMSPAVSGTWQKWDRSIEDYLKINMIVVLQLGSHFRSRAKPSILLPFVLNPNHLPRGFMEHLLSVTLEDPDSHRRVFNPLLQVCREIRFYRWEFSYELLTHKPFQLWTKFLS